MFCGKGQPAYIGASADERLMVGIIYPMRLSNQKLLNHLKNIWDNYWEQEKNKNAFHNATDAQSGREKIHVTADAYK